MDVEEALARYAAGFFPLDDRPEDPDIPFYSVAERAVFELDAGSRAVLARRVRRSLRACADLELAVDAHFEEVLTRCAEPTAGDGVWITARMKTLYRELHDAGFAHAIELVDPADGSLAAGILAVTIGRAAMLESMRRVRSDAGNALLSRALDMLAARGAILCDVQLPTDHTLRLGARLVPREEYEVRLAAALTN